MTSRPPLRYSLLKRSLTGLAMLVFGTAGVAWLMHAGIENDGDRAVAGITTGSIARGPLAEVRSWAPYASGRHEVDLLVVDPRRIAGNDAALPRAIEDLKRGADARSRQVLARISIASTSAEQLHWLLGPGQRDVATLPWLDTGHADKAGRWPVSYWMTDWQSLVWGSSTALVDRIASVGFDGIYIADGDSYLAHRAKFEHAEAELVLMIERLASRAKHINPYFVIVLANAEELITHPAIRGSVDAVARQDLMFGTDEMGRANPRSAVVASLHFLARARREGLQVLV